MPDGSTSHATYGDDGELTTTVDPAGGTQSFTYDALGRPDDLHRPARAGESTSALRPRRQRDVIDRRHRASTATNTYDADNRLLSTSYGDGATPTVSDAYDADGRRTSMTDGTGTTTYQYDSLGRMTRHQRRPATSLT